MAANMFNGSILPAGSESFSSVTAKGTVQDDLKSVLLAACIEKRLTIGLMNAISFLSDSRNSVLFCITTAAPPGDSATHMQEVLLQAFCAENDIYVVKIDSGIKLAQLLGARPDLDFSCILVHFPYTDPYQDTQDLENVLTKPEKSLIERIENWNGTTPIIKLPEK